jgi:hypothetical protein
MGLLDSATTLIDSAKSSATNLISGPAASLSSITDTVTGAIGSLGSIFKPMPGVKLPLANPLFAYASYDYVISIGVLTDEQLQNPDKTYMKNQRIPLICKSANGDPKNRIQTAFGAFDFMIDKLDIQSSIGLEKGNTTNMLNMTFSIIEPYSMGMFLMSLQQAAWDSGHDNYLDAPYLMTIDFRGNTETGKMVNIPNTSRKIPFKFRTVTANVTEKGAVYQCDAYPTNASAQGAQHAQLKTDISIKGKTVQEVLQTGEKSLQAVLNKRLQQLKIDKIVDEPDEILILFPTDPSSDTPAGSTSEDKSTATTNTGTSAKDTLSKKLGVTRSAANKTLVQTNDTCNDLGKAKLGFSETRKGDSAAGKDNKVWDPEKKVFVRANNFIDPETGDYRFSQDTDIMNAISQVILNSDFVKTTLGADKLTKEGYRTWFRIDTQVYHTSPTQNATGVKAKLIVYRVVTYQVHASKLLPPNVKAPGFPELKKQAVKEYNYIYTGKNVDIINFNLDFKVGFAAVMGAAKLGATQDAQLASNASGAEEKNKSEQKPMPSGNPVEKKPGVNPTQVKYIGTNFKTDKRGGGGLEDESTRIARMFHDALTSGADMIALDLKIIGDPYFIAQSGQGNYTSQQTEFGNLNADGSVNYQNGEVDILVNFRTPVDINQTTGLYDFGKSSKSAPVLSWSGLYQVINVTSSFAGGQFTQTLTGTRRPSQELSTPATPAKQYSTANTVPDAAQPVAGRPRGGA